jgi:hypothetical protein
MDQKLSFVDSQRRFSAGGTPVKYGFTLASLARIFPLRTRLRPEALLESLKLYLVK